MNVVGIAPNGEEGVKVVLREKPDLVLMDINMPVMHGFEATQRILAEYDVCIVMLTAYSDEENISKGRALGVQAYVTKPVISETLLASLEKILQSL